jgi:uncharacterized repeat protein (TIGR03847 family)
MPQHIELNPVSHLTVGTRGKPGERTFYLQGSRGTQTITLVIEKEQARMLVSSFESLLHELEQQLGTAASEISQVFHDMRLRDPIEVLFRVGNMGLGYNEESGQIVLVAYELVEEDEDPSVVSFWISPDMVRGLIPHINDVIRSGRFVDPGATVAPEQNGHVH